MMKLQKLIFIINFILFLLGSSAELFAQSPRELFFQSTAPQNSQGMPFSAPQLSSASPSQGVPQNLPQGTAQGNTPFTIPQTPNPITPVTTDSRIKTLVYNANEVYQLKFHYGYQSFIEFSENEEIEMISIGESFAWRLTPAGKRLFVRPLEIGAHTNMTIITNKRTYQFDIASAEYDGRADEELVYTVRFYYPEAGIAVPIPPQLSRPNVARQPATVVVKAPLAASYADKSLEDDVSGGNQQFNFLYSVAGRADNITPLKIYDNGKETFFQFKDRNLVIPAINTVDLFGNEQPTGYAIREGFVVVQGVSSQFTLRLADSLICVFNERIAARPTGARNNIYERVNKPPSRLNPNQIL